MWARWHALQKNQLSVPITRFSDKGSAHYWSTSTFLQINGQKIFRIACSKVFTQSGSRFTFVKKTKVKVHMFHLAIFIRVSLYDTYWKVWQMSLQMAQDKMKFWNVHKERTGRHVWLRVLNRITEWHLHEDCSYVTTSTQIFPIGFSQQIVFHLECNVTLKIVITTSCLVLAISSCNKARQHSLSCPPKKFINSSATPLKRLILKNPWPSATKCNTSGYVGL